MSWKGWESYKPEEKIGQTIKVYKPWTLDDSPKKPSKYHAVKTAVDGLTFDSKREAARYQVLVARMKAGDLRRLRVQPRYTLCPLVVLGADIRNVNVGEPSNRRVPLCEYVADFEYEESDRGFGGITWKLVVEDVKGVRTDVYRLKRRWFEAQYGVEIIEI